MAERGGYRPGGKAKKPMNKDTFERMVVLESIRQRIMANQQKLIDAQFSLAEGVSFLYKVAYETDSRGEKHKTRPELVTDPGVIEDYLDGKLDNEDGEDRGDYYYITTQAPDNRAIDSLLDRTFGKAVQTTMIGGDQESPLVITDGGSANDYADFLKIRHGKDKTDESAVEN